MPQNQPRITIEQFREIWPADAPAMRIYRFEIEQIGYGDARVRLLFDEHHVRPGETLSGPAMMTLGDYTIWAAVLGMTGPDYHNSATSNLNVNFLRRPALADLVAESRIIRQGRRLAVGEATIYSDGESDPVAHITATYAMAAPVTP
ncbi:MAG: PaaI family thioesterase [Alphaproteobacteria bacterium]|nr:PaaI family thioesterase [Alphaproteobacteria bacterium]